MRQKTELEVASSKYVKLGYKVCNLKEKIQMIEEERLIIKRNVQENRYSTILTEQQKAMNSGRN